VLRAALGGALVGWGCSADHAAAPADGAAGGPALDAPAELASRLPPDFRCDPTLASIRDGIFVTSCNFDYCHGSIAYAYDLWLTADLPALSKELVGVAAKSCKGQTRVVAGDPDRSYLWHKIADARPACGARMPHGLSPLPQVALDCVRGWIASLADSGAPSEKDVAVDAPTD